MDTWWSPDVLPTFWKEPYPWPGLRITLDGLSSIDLPRLSIHAREDALRFLDGYGFDLERPRDRARALTIHGEAVAFIQRYFLSGTDLTIPPEVTHPRDLPALLMLASDERLSAERLQPWACAVLRVMHTVAHCDDDLRLMHFREIRGQILENYRQHVHTEGERVYLGEGPSRVPLASFKVKERKDRDSVLMKLMHKPSNVAEQIFDRLGVRLVTRTLLDALLALRYLRDHQVFSFANIQPDQSKNALLDFPRFLAQLDALEGDCTEAQARTLLEESLRLPEGTLIQPENASTQRNPHSLAGYRAIQFTARQRIRVTPRGRTRLKAASMVLDAARVKADEMARRVEAMLRAAAAPSPELVALLEDAQEGTRTLDEAARHTDPLGLEDEVAFFFPYEVHILDEECDRRNETGRSSHAEYKARQREAARRRVLGRLL